MTVGRALRFAAGASAALACGYLLLMLWRGPAGTATSLWALRGFFATAIPGLLAGTWLAVEHGRPGWRFVAALGCGLATRVIAVAAVAFAASRADAGAGPALLLGLAAGWVPLAVFEAMWFLRRLPTAAAVRS